MTDRLVAHAEGPVPDGFARGSGMAMAKVAMAPRGPGSMVFLKGMPRRPSDRTGRAAGIFAGSDRQ